ncbi:MAG: TIGR02466 family protein [Rhodospirillaceae bacterium]
MSDFEDGVVDIWPTKLLRRRLPDFDEPNRALLKLIREMEKTNRNLTTDYRDNNLLNLDHPGANWLRGEVNASVIEYLQTIGIDFPVDWQIHAWANINRLGDYHDLHNHPHSYLSGTYYVKVPTGRDAGSRSDLRPNRITFYDPRPGVNMISIRSDPYIDPEFTVMPEPGLLLLWPAFLNHFVHPNLSKETRVSVSFNIVLKWADHYLPTQE